jgi:hypothetical protein
MTAIENILERIQHVEITWIVTKDDRRVFDAVFEGEHVQLRQNDFPDEPPATLFIRVKKST